MTLRKVSYAASFILLASTSLSWATVVTETEAFGPANTNWGTSTQTPGFLPTQTLNFSGFNAALGTLNSVVITVTESITGSVTLTNNPTSSSSAQVYAHIVNNPKATVPGLGTPSFNFEDSSTTYTQTLAPGASSGAHAVTGSALATSTIVNPSILSVYETAWTASVGDLGSVSSGASNGNGSATYVDNGTISILASYSYTPPSTPAVPEPASVALLGLGIAGVGVIRRRRKA